MDSLNYLTTYSTAFGAPEVIFLIAHVALALAGLYYAFIAKFSDTLRGESLRLLGYGLLALGIVGTLVAVLRLAVGAEFSMPIWMTLVTVLDVALIAYALYSRCRCSPAPGALALSNRNAARCVAAGDSSRTPISARTAQHIMPFAPSRDDHARCRVRRKPQRR